HPLPASHLRIATERAATSPRRSERDTFLSLGTEAGTMVSTSDGRVFAFRVYLPHAGAVELVGDFTQWCDDGIPLRRSQTGWWEGDVPIRPGDHRFSYLVDGRHWMPDYAAGGLERDPAGNLVSALVVCSDDAME